MIDDSRTSTKFIFQPHLIVTTRINLPGLERTQSISCANKYASTILSLAWTFWRAKFSRADPSLAVNLKKEISSSFVNFLWNKPWKLASCNWENSKNSFNGGINDNAEMIWADLRWKFLCTWPRVFAAVFGSHVARDKYPIIRCQQWHIQWWLFMFHFLDFYVTADIWTCCKIQLDHWECILILLLFSWKMAVWSNMSLFCNHGPEGCIS